MNSIPLQNKETIDDRAIALAERRQSVEFDLLAAVLADPSHLWPPIVADGVTPAHFSADDARAMAGAIEAEHSSRGRALEAVLSSLIEAGHFDDSVPAGTSAAVSRWWSIRRLVRWSRRYLEAPDLEPLVAMQAAALLELAERMETAAALADEYFRLTGSGVRHAS